jgi:hypothetical protein
MPTIDETKNPVPLNIGPDKVGFIILKAREFDVKVDPEDEEADEGSNPADDDDRAVLEDRADDPTLEELRCAIDDLNDDEIVDLIALAWVGRGDFERNEWSSARRLARERHRRHSADYLIGMPALGDYLEEGMATLGYSSGDQESDRL